MTAGGERFRSITNGRRAGGWSSKTWDGNDMNACDDDLAHLIGAFELRDVVLVGCRTAGEAAVCMDLPGAPR